MVHFLFKGICSVRINLRGSIMTGRLGLACANWADGEGVGALPRRSVTISTAKEYQRLMLAALMSRSVLQPPAVNQADMLEQDSIDEVIEPARLYKPVA